jgi:hypothetical protein
MATKAGTKAAAIDKYPVHGKFVYVDELRRSTRSFESASEDAYRSVNRVAFKQNFKTLLSHFEDPKRFGRDS